jgi:hypothetical protein
MSAPNISFKTALSPNAMGMILSRRLRLERLLEFMGQPGIERPGRGGYRAQDAGALSEDPAEDNLIEIGDEVQNMNRRDKILYHQIHPLKLGTDILSVVVSLYFFWEHQLLIALVLHIAPPIIASFLVISFADLERQRQSAFGQYVKGMVTHTVLDEAIRLSGDIVMVLGAWYHSWVVIVLGFAIIVGSWLRGILKT